MNKSVVGGAVLVLLLAVIGVSVVLIQNVDALVKSLIEQIGTEVTGTKVSVQDVKLDLSNGAGEINGFTLANPTGFSTNNLLELDKIGVSIDVESLSGSVLVVERLFVDGARVRTEQKGTETNVQTLMDNIESGPGGGGNADSEETNENDGPLLAVNEIDFLNSSIHLSSDVFGEENLTMPDFRLRNLGSKEKGLTTEELGYEITFQVVGQIASAVSDALAEHAREAASEALKSKISESAAESIDKLKSLFDKD